MYGDGLSVWQDKVSKKWVVQVRIAQPGKPVRKIQRRAASRTEARQLGQEIRRGVKTSRKKTELTTFSYVLDKYRIQKAVEIKASTLSQYIHLIGLYASPCFGNLPIERIDSQAISDLLLDMRSRGLTASTVNTLRARLVDLFGYAKRAGLIQKDPMGDVRRHRADALAATAVKDPWTVEEAKRALEASKDTAIETFMAIALTTGMRKGEILALTWNDIDFDGQEVRVTKSRGEKRILSQDGTFKSQVLEDETKTKASLRSLDLNPFILKALQRQLERNALAGKQIPATDHIVTSQSNQPLSLSTLHRTYTRVCKEAGLRRIRIHDLRHTVAVLALQSGVPLVELSQGLGHSGVEITKRTYAPRVPGLAGRFTSKVCEVLAGDPQG